MKRLYFHFAAVMLCALLCSCQQHRYRISGTADNLSDGDTLLVLRALDLQAIDTLVVSASAFQAEGKADSSFFCLLVSQRHQDFVVPFFMQTGNIDIQCSQGKNKVGGTSLNDDFQAFNDSINTMREEIIRQSSYIYGNNLSKEETERISEQLKKLNDKMSTYIISTASKNLNNEFGVFLVTQTDNSIMSDEIRKKLIWGMNDKMSHHPSVMALKQHIEKASKVAVGRKIFPFEMYDNHGEVKKIESLIAAHKMTILDFWASWCGPCRREMPFMVELYKQYQKRGLEIIGISLDKDENAWKNAISEMKMKWPQLSDLSGWESMTAENFGVEAIPYTVVVDSKGIILANGLRGEELETFVQKNLAR